MLDRNDAGSGVHTYIIRGGDVIVHAHAFKTPLVSSGNAFANILKESSLLAALRHKLLARNVRPAVRISHSLIEPPGEQMLDHHK